MIIISDFYDYYDSIQRMGQDRSILFLRKRVEHLTRSGLYFSCPNGSPGIVAFCGQLFPFITIGYHTSNNGITEWHTEHHYSPSHLNIKDIYQRQSLHRFFNEPNGFALREYMDKHPVVVQYGGKREDLIVVNDNLSKIDFQKVVDPYTAFIEINNFLSNIAQPRKPIPGNTDLEKIQSHGFDKFSFRKEPTKKKRT